MSLFISTLNPPAQDKLISDPARVCVLVEYWLPVHVDVAGYEPAGPRPHHDVSPPHASVMLPGDVIRHQGGRWPV